MKRLALLVSAFLAAALPMVADEAADIAKYGVTIPTTGLVPAVIEDEALSELDRDFSTDTTPIDVDLRPRFTITGLRGMGYDLVQFRTSLGTINAELLADGTDAGAEDLDPHVSVNNFKSYVATDASPKAVKAQSYDATIFHRFANLGSTDTPRKILQGGGYKANLQLSPVPKKPEIVREFHYANTRGTIAMARTDNPDSATSEWFFNLNDNTPIFNAGAPDSTTDDNTYAVFARVIGNGMSVVDRIGALPTTSLGGAFSSLPLRNWSSGRPVMLANLVAVESVRIVPLQPADTGKGGSVLTYSFTNDNPSAASVTLSPAGRLLVTKGKRGGRAIITVRASEAGGASVTSVLTVTHPGAPFVVKQLPATTVTSLGSTLTLTADITAWPLFIRWQRLPAGTADIPANWVDIALDDARFEGADTEYLKIKLTGAAAENVGNALELNGSKLRFRLANTEDAAAPLISRPTLLKVSTTLAFAGKLAATTTAALGSNITLSAPAAGGTYPAPTYQWERKAPDGDWTPIVDLKAHVVGSGSNANPEIPAIRSPYTGTKTANLVIRLNGPEALSQNSTSITVLETLALHLSQYRCVISHDRGDGPIFVQSAPTTLRITSVPVGVATQPAKVFYGFLSYTEADIANKTTISVVAKPAASNTPVKYQWQRLNAATGQWDDLVNHVAAEGENPGAPTPYSNVTTNTLTVRLPSASNLDAGFGLNLDGAQYRCVLTNVLKTASAPFGPAAGQAISATTTLRIVSGVQYLATDNTFILPGTPAPSPSTGRTYSATGLPAGLTINSEGVITGFITAKPGLYKVVLTVAEGSNRISTTYYIVVEPLGGGTAGSFEALLSPADGPHYAKLELQIAGTGALTGILTTATEAKPLPLRGSVVRDYDTGELSFAAPIVVAIPGAPAGRSYVLTDLLVTPTGYLAVKLHTRANASATPVQVASATYIPGDADTPPSGNFGRQLARHDKNNPAPWANITRYTLAFLNASPLDPGSHVRAVPAGHGYATGSVGADGKLSIRGKLGDGATLTATLPADVDGDLRLFLRPYGSLSGGVLSAYLDLTPRPSYTSDYYSFYRYSIAYSLGNENPADDFDDGAQVYWNRPAGASKPAAYAAGFGPLGLTARIEPWYVSNYSQLGFTEASDQKSATIDLDLSGSTVSNAEPNSRELPVAIRLSYLDGTFSDATPPDASRFSLQLRGSDGFVSGTLFIRDTVDGAVRERKIPYEGVFLVPAENFGFGGGVVPAGKITAAGLTLVPALPGGAPETGGFMLVK